MNGTKALTERFTAAVETGGDVSAVFNELDMAIGDAGVFPEAVMTRLLGALHQERTCHSRELAHLIKLFEYNLDLLDGEARRVLIEALQEALPHVSDPAAAMLMYEIMVDASADAGDLGDRLIGFSQAANPVTRGLVAYGLDYLLKRAPERQGELGDRVKRTLERLSHDRDAAVQREAQAVLQKRFKP